MNAGPPRDHEQHSQHQPRKQHDTECDQREPVDAIQAAPRILRRPERESPAGAALVPPQGRMMLVHTHRRQTLLRRHTVPIDVGSPPLNRPNSSDDRLGGGKLAPCAQLIGHADAAISRTSSRTRHPRSRAACSLSGAPVRSVLARSGTAACSGCPTGRRLARVGYLRCPPLPRGRWHRGRDPRLCLVLMVGHMATSSEMGPLMNGANASSTGICSYAEA